ncbi:PstS family phosphate ABC transporter substrate-binding protein [Saccharothrix coeruleofusca]|uniref:Phosphate-binding protein n=1 Tax=Saccharothrix coeruleofusca TaxID=33919 RepID=A0A918EED2_9PSEU|nr:substrate-binding domain-containing protein [Saccharothrix coeruleofusca]GGP51930.1 phosphate-binding protein [Saccharothrix coeruleofusca]
MAIALLFAAPVIDRLFVRRKRISYRVLYNSKIGLGPEQLHDGADGAPTDAPRLRELVDLLDRMSIVVLRVRNSGNYDIEPDDFEKPLSVTFGERVVWNARVSEAASDELRGQVRRNLRFLRSEAAPTDRDTLRTVRERLGQRLVRWWYPAADTAAADTAEPLWHGVRLEPFTLPRKQKFKLVVVLRQPGDGGEIDKEVKISGRLGGAGVLHDEKRQRTFTLRRLTGGLGVVLAAVLLVTLWFAPPAADPSVACAGGALRVEGSSVFMPALKSVADEYTRICPGATITTQPTGSIEGARAVAAVDPAKDPAGAGGLMALSDGKQDGVDLPAQQVAVVVYHVVVHSSVGLDTLTTAQLRDIYAGVYTDWSQLRGGAALPIRIVGRGGESGTRELFERRVLLAGESGLSSDDCRTKDRDPAAPVIRCERSRNADVVREIASVEGAIGYADAASVAETRKTGALSAISLDGRVFDAAAGVEAGYPFWTVEYLYTRTEPKPGSLQEAFLRYLRTHDTARVRVKDAGYLPCATAEGTPLELCNLR